MWNILGILALCVLAWRDTSPYGGAKWGLVCGVIIGAVLQGW